MTLKDEKDVFVYDKYMMVCSSKTRVGIVRNMGEEESRNKVIILIHNRTE